MMPIRKFERDVTKRVRLNIFFKRGAWIFNEYFMVRTMIQRFWNGNEMHINVPRCMWCKTRYL